MNLQKYKVAITMATIIVWASWFIFISTVAPGKLWAFFVFHVLLLLALVSGFATIALRISTNNKMIIRRAILLAALFIIPLILQGLRVFNLFTLLLLIVAVILIDFWLDGKAMPREGKRN
ncbi:MAG: hypothetical protein V1902_03475 [Candidatus Falkowbacteria bacterium]